MKNFEERFLPVTEDCIFTEDGYYVWCGSLFRHGDSYYLAYSRWKREYGFEAWVTHSEICLAKSDSPLGKMHYVRTMHNGIHTLQTRECVARYTSPGLLISIRNGEHIDPVTMRPDSKFFRIMDILENELDAVLKLDLLPEEPHYSEINRLLAEVNARALGIAPHTYF